MKSRYQLIERGSINANTNNGCSHASPTSLFSTNLGNCSINFTDCAHFSFLSLSLFVSLEISYTLVIVNIFLVGNFKPRDTRCAYTSLYEFRVARPAICCWANFTWTSCFDNFFAFEMYTMIGNKRGVARKAKIRAF